MLSRMKQCRLLTVLLCLSLLGCGSAPQLDASSDEAWEASIAAAEQSLPEDERDGFQGALMILLMTAAFKANSEAGFVLEPDSAWQAGRESLDGKTGSEIMAAFEELTQRDPEEVAAEVLKTGMGLGDAAELPKD